MKRSEIKERRRTTLTLETDVNQYIEEYLKTNKKLKEKDLVNDLIRKGIRAKKDSSHKTVSFTRHKAKLLIPDDELEKEIKKIL